MYVCLQAVLGDGSEVAVKEVSVASQQCKADFINEVTLISRIQHQNLVKLKGCSIKGTRKLLVYEYLSNKSLDRHIFDGHQNHVLDWQTRFNILVGVARGLAYLHEECDECIVHRDIKASNILLDKNFQPKIADFGFAKLVNNGISLNTRVVGTLGYVAPEYALHGRLTEKVDVFSYGILAIEVLSGGANITEKFSERNGYLLYLAWMLCKEGMIDSILDPRLRGTVDLDEVKRVVCIALSCSQPNPLLRPAMTQVVSMLLGSADVVETPPRPDIFGEHKRAFDSISESCKYKISDSCKYNMDSTIMSENTRNSTVDHSR